jgi:Arc/MetJ-type ribon-helix-helix transcriptional regulator
MSRVSATFSVSLPPEMVEEVERARKNEHRTRSEFVREALRQYMGRGTELRRLRQRMAELSEADPTTDEIAAVADGRRAFQEGEFISLADLRHGLDNRSEQPRRKKSQTTPRR